MEMHRHTRASSRRDLARPTHIERRRKRAQTKQEFFNVSVQVVQQVAKDILFVALVYRVKLNRL